MNHQSFFENDKMHKTNQRDGSALIQRNNNRLVARAILLTERNMFIDGNFQTNVGIESNGPSV